MKTIVVALSCLFALSLASCNKTNNPNNNSASPAKSMIIGVYDYSKVMNVCIQRKYCTALQREIYVQEAKLRRLEEFRGAMLKEKKRINEDIEIIKAKQIITPQIPIELNNAFKEISDANKYVAIIPAEISFSNPNIITVDITDTIIKYLQK